VRGVMNGDRPTGAPERGPLVIVGGYGLVGAHAARLLRARHPRLELVLAGRHPERARTLARELRAATAYVDVDAQRPLSALPDRPGALLACCADPADGLLADALREAVPLADVDRGEPAALLDVALRTVREPAAAPLLLAGGWMGGTAALLAGALTRLSRAPSRIALTVLASSGDRVGDGAWGPSRRWAWPYHVHERGERRVAHPLTGVRRVRCPDGRERASVRIGTLEQATLPLTLEVPTVESRLALHAQAELLSLVALKRTGVLRALERRRLRAVRRRLLERSGAGDLTGFTIAVEGPGRTLALDVLDPRGLAHLTAVGAALAAERVLGLAGAALPAGVCFPEQRACPLTDTAVLTAAGAVLRPHGFALADLAPALPADDYETAALLDAILKEPLAP
jgi:hypothetical protein